MLDPIPVPTPATQRAEQLDLHAACYEYVIMLAALRNPDDPHIRVSPTSAKQTLGSLVTGARVLLATMRPPVEGSPS